MSGDPNDLTMVLKPRVEAEVFFSDRHPDVTLF
jgi:hypothetical protein